VGADHEPGQWMSHGRTYDEQRYSPLERINAQNVAQLKLAWHHDLDAIPRGQSSTPLVIDGVMYVTSTWSKVFALDAVTGKLLWTYDPQVPGEWGVNACCDVVNRGVAAWNGKIYHRQARLGNTDHRPQPALRHHRRAAHRQRQGADRQCRIGVRRTRLHLGL
jgi:glucose dehydrogenase